MREVGRGKGCRITRRSRVAAALQGKVDSPTGAPAETSSQPKSDGLVCFAHSLPFNDEDRFLTIVITKPNTWFQNTKSGPASSEGTGSFYDGRTDFAATSLGSLALRVWENQDWSNGVDSYLEGAWHSYGHYERSRNGQSPWKSYGDIPPVFRFASDKDEITGATNVTAMDDGSILNASKKYANRGNGTTVHEMNVRLSTGRYKETWTPDKGDPMESVGNCYKAKSFANTTQTRKAK